MFVWDRRPSAELLRAVAQLEPANPFFTAAYVEAQRTLGFEPIVVGLWSEGQPRLACPAYVRRERLRQRLHIPSLPRLPDGDQFWSGVLRLCRHERLRLLVVDSYASGVSGTVMLPALPGEISRRARTEFVVSLRGADPSAAFSSNHRRNIARARQRDIKILRSHEPAACAAHDQLVHASLHRRAVRGEDVRVGSDRPKYEALTRTGAAEVFQAVRGDQVLSSLLIVRAAAGAYYQSAGTAPDGMAAGASHLLVAEILATLRTEGLHVFNLGGADEEASGLRRFKTGFGARAVELEAAQFSLEPFVVRNARAVLRALRDRRRRPPSPDAERG